MLEDRLRDVECPREGSGVLDSGVLEHLLELLQEGEHEVLAVPEVDELDE